MKQQILTAIYNAFENWVSKEHWSCEQGCSACCSRNVTITAQEGERILDYIIEKKQEKQFARQLEDRTGLQKPKWTVNVFAKSCLAGKEVEPEQQVPHMPCPFLDDNSCTIYTVRPFSCRSFLSQNRCIPQSPALVPNHHIAASTVINQIIEHLGQREYYGNMLDVLPAMLDISKYKPILDNLNDKTVPITCRQRTLTAIPLPGFLLSQEDFDKVSPLLEEIFTRDIEGKSIEDILNGK